jgi:hypothetical protein
MYQPPRNGSNGIDDYANVVVTGRELASVLGLSENSIRSLRKRGVIQAIRSRINKNEYQLGPAVRGYLQFKCGQDSPSEADFHRERALKERANRQLREILLEQTRDQLHHCDDVRAIVGDSNAQIRSQLLAFGNLLALQVTGKTDPAEVKAIIDTQVRNVLLALCNYRPGDYYRRSKIALSLIKEPEEEPEQTAPCGFRP